MSELTLAAQVARHSHRPTNLRGPFIFLQDVTFNGAEVKRGDPVPVDVLDPVQTGALFRARIIGEPSGSDVPLNVDDGAIRAHVALARRAAREEADHAAALAAAEVPVPPAGDDDDDEIPEDSDSDGELPELLDDDEGIAMLNAPPEATTPTADAPPNVPVAPKKQKSKKR